MSGKNLVSCLVGAAIAFAPCHLLAAAGGFYQSLYTGGQDVATGDPMADGIVVDAAGLTFSGNSYKVGGTDYKVGDNTTAAYKTYWKMTAGTTYRFVKNYDDTGRIRITGPNGVTTEVLHHTDWSSVAYGSYTPAQTGWHVLDLRVGNGAGGVGPTTSPFNDKAKLGAGLAWTTAEGVTACTDANYAQWNRFENREGEQPVFRTRLADVAMGATYDAANARANVSVTLAEISSETARVTVDYPSAAGAETMVIAESASVSSEPLTAQVPLVAGATSRLTVRVTMGDDEETKDFFVYAGEVSIAAGGDADVNNGVAAGGELHARRHGGSGRRLRGTPRFRDDSGGRSERDGRRHPEGEPQHRGSEDAFVRPRGGPLRHLDRSRGGDRRFCRAVGNVGLRCRCEDDFRRRVGA